MEAWNCPILCLQWALMECMLSGPWGAEQGSKQASYQKVGTGHAGIAFIFYFVSLLFRWLDALNFNQFFRAFYELKTQM